MVGPRQIEPPETARTLPDLLSARARATPDAEVLRFESSSLTASELEAGALRIAGRLASVGVQGGDRIGILAPNGVEVPLAWLAVPFLRAVSVPMNPAWKEQELAYVLRHAGVSVVLAGPGQRSAVEAAAERVEGVRAVIELSEELWRGGSPDAADVRASDAVEPDEAVTIQYTSGTTGFPKGCVLHHGYWLRLARTIADFTGLGRGDVLLTAQPQSYMDPSWNLVLALLLGVPLVVLRRFSASTFWQDASRHRATFFYCIGTMPLYMLERPANAAVDRGHSVRLVYCSGIPAGRHAEIENRWGCPWRETYGTTELGVVLATLPAEAETVGSGSMGTVVEHRAVRVVDADGRDVPSGTVGELLVQGPDLMRGYFGDPVATESWMPDGWARTGDQVIASGNGLRHVGRTKDMIRRAGENIAAAEVEAVLMQHPGVIAAACIPVPDDLRGEEVKAYVQRARDDSGREPDERALHAFAAKHLARFKLPRYIEFVDSFPLTQSEKIAKAEVISSRADHRAGSWDSDHHS
jgi:acyl-CoA synthetase (AMP-forming)/AMP-acid ligase II